MRIAFYAPLKAPTHPVPSGDRRMARMLMAALEMAGHEVFLACRLRSWDDGRRSGRPERLACLGDRMAGRLTARLGRKPPDLWFTYHLYHKAPDYLGPAVSRALGIPYVVAEASFAPKRADGPWATGHRAAERAIRQADRIFVLASVDADCLRPLVRDPAMLVPLPPFLDTRPYATIAESRATTRSALASRWHLDSDQPWMLTVGMMRPGDKERSYQVLAQALKRVANRPWTLLVAGDGPRRQAVEALFQCFAPERVRFLGEQRTQALTGLYASADMMVWPAINEAYGMALLEAQAAGVPVVAGCTGGVPDIVRDRRTGLLAPPGDVDGLAAAVAALLDDPARRLAFANQARHSMHNEHDIMVAVQRLQAALVGLRTGH